MQPHIAAAVAFASMVAMSATALARQPQTPLTPIRTLVLTAQPTKAFGEYQPLASPVLASGDHLHVYGEPGDFGWHSKNDAVGFDVVAAIEVRGRNGRITGKAEPRPMQHQAASRPESFFFSLSVKVEGGIGAYNLVVRLRDAINGEVAEVVFPFVLANKRQAPSAPTTAQVVKSAPADESARPLDCRQYFPQIDEMISVQCAGR